MVGRFKEKPIGGPLGPGQYMSQNRVDLVSKKHLPKISANFASTARSDNAFNKNMIDMPGPQDYIADLGKTVIKESGDKKPFGANTIRFATIDNGVPGAGTYKLPDSCQVKNSK